MPETGWAMAKECLTTPPISSDRKLHDPHPHAHARTADQADREDLERARIAVASEQVRYRDEERTRDDRHHRIELPMQREVREAR